MFNQAQNAATLVATYTNNARFNTRHCTALAIQLERVAPADLTADQRAALEAVGKRAAEVDEVRKTRQRLSPPALQAARHGTASAWSALHSALVAMATLPSELGPEAAEAERLDSSLFPEGTSFGLLDAVGLWSHSRVLLERIEEEGVRGRIESLVSPLLLRAVNRAHDQLGESIGVAGTSTVPTPSPRALLDASARFSYAVGAYARALSVGMEDTDEAALERFVAALSPIDALRVTGKADDDASGEESTEPVVSAPTTVVAAPAPAPVPADGPFAG